MNKITLECVTKSCAVFIFAVACSFAFIAVAEEKDPLDSLEVEDANAMPMNPDARNEGKRLEREVHAKRRDMSKLYFKLKIRLASEDDLAAFDKKIGADPSFGKMSLDPKQRLGNISRRRERQEMEREGWRPPSLREYVLEQAKQMEQRLFPERFAFSYFSPEFPRNPNATALSTSASDDWSGDINSESTRVRSEVFRSHRYKEQVHPGSAQFR